MQGKSIEPQRILNAANNGTPQKTKGKHDRKNNKAKEITKHEHFNRLT